MLCSELDSLQEAQGLINAAPNGQVVDCRLLKDALGVDDEQATECHALVLEQHSIPGCNFLPVTRPG